MDKALLLCPFMISLVTPIFGKSGGPYSCSCNSEISNSSDVFFEVVKKIQCCEGRIRCNKPNSTENTGEYEFWFLCFSETSCIYNAEQENVSCSYRSSKCGSDFSLLNISNTFDEWSLYKCFSVKNANFSLCLFPTCKSFGAVERNCFCDHVKKECICNSDFSEQKSKLKPLNTTFALFLSFGDNYVVRKTRFSTVTLLVALFCSLFLLGFLVVLLKGVRVLTVSSPGQNQRTLSDTFMRLCRLRPRSLNNSELSLPPPCNVPKLRSDRQNAPQFDNALPTYDEAIRNERAIHTIELPPTYADLSN